MNDVTEFVNQKYNEKWKIEYANVRFFGSWEQYSFGKHLYFERESEEIKKANMPKLYKYCSFDKDGYNISNLSKSQVYLRNPCDFNDPFDSIFSMSIRFEDILDELLENAHEFSMEKEMILKNERNIKKTFDKILDREAYKRINQWRKLILVSCFSEINDSILMWSHYADSHTGFCIEYDFLNNYDEQYCVYPVLYTNKLCTIESYPPNDWFLLFTTLLKSYEWKYEKEWRLCHTNHEYGNPEYGEVPKPTAIYLGAAIKNENQKEIIDYANSNRISVYKMRLSSRKYELLAEKLL